jgi:hypothetical protein
MVRTKHRAPNAPRLPRAQPRLLLPLPRLTPSPTDEMQMDKATHPGTPFHTGHPLSALVSAPSSPVGRPPKCSHGAPRQSPRPTAPDCPVQCIYKSTSPNGCRPLPVEALHSVSVAASLFFPKPDATINHPPHSLIFFSCAGPGAPHQLGATRGADSVAP